MQITKSSIDTFGAEMLWTAVNIDNTGRDDTYSVDLSISGGATTIASASFISDVAHVNFYGKNKDKVVDQARDILRSMVGGLAEHLDITTEFDS